ncbi:MULTISPECIES: FtsK/SpoIIIE domain-containing protein [unclassified Pseudoclavibacter]|uniref:FtsK/SpoIIIE domain-containing protein n=1 Tax=unclassified Pseudoclavibacter TaxID=2615177 RepID=UPI001BAAE749|nr:FtsK/SpoIIIE domain-containing protein [Pseudoclavibacter sp. Marseille-Q4354]MBS3180044.1 ATP-binding protein [Pseudoclavibacter sp. Marseille-Q4354]
MVIPTVNAPPPQRLLRPRTLGQWAQEQLLLSLIVWPWILLAYGPMSLSPRKLDRDRLDPPDFKTYPILGAISRFLWASGGMVLLFSLVPFSQIVTIPLMLVVIARWSARPYGLPLRDLVGRAASLIRTSDRWRIAGWVAVGGLGVVVLLIVVAAIASATGARLPSELAHGFWAGLAPVLVGAALAREVGSEHKETAAHIERRSYAVAAGVAALLGGHLNTAEKVLAAGILAPHNEDEGFTISPVPQGVVIDVGRKGLEVFDGAVSSVFPNLHASRFDHEAIVLTPLTPEVERRRALLAASNGMVEASETQPDGRVVWQLAEGVSPARAEEANLLAENEGLTLIEWAPLKRRAVLDELSETELAVRTAVAAGLGIADRPWAIEVELEDQEDDEAPVRSITVRRIPAGTLTARREAAWQEALHRVPGGHPDWTVEEEPGTGTAVLTHRPPRRLPALVPAAELIAAPGAAVSWSKIPLGRTDAGTEAVLDLKAGPHSLIVGGTGSGKSVASRLLVLQALARGFEVVYIDPTKKGAGLRDFQPHVKVWATDSKAQAAAVMEAVYSEVRRRVDLIDEAGVEDWTELPGVKPWLIVLDEFRGLTAMPIKPAEAKGPKATAYGAAVENRDTIIGTMGLMAAEARSAGIHLVVLTQRPDAKIIEGEIRENLGSVIQLIPAGRPPSPEALRMTFTDAAADAVEEMNALKNGRPGFALSFIDGGGVRGFRVGLLNPEQVAPLLQDHAIPAGIPLDYTAPSADANAAAAAAVFGTEVAEPEEVVAEEEMDLSDLLGDFSFDDLDSGDGFTPPDLSADWGK